jgi:pilus assembly protein CpaF
VYVERKGKLARVPTSFRNNAHLLAIIDRIVSRVGRRVDESSPMVDARLPDGSRVNAIIPPLALDGPVLSIRRFGAQITIDQLLELGALTTEMVDLLAGCVQARLNMLISGGTGSGKTTLLNALSSFIPASERIVTIEDARNCGCSRSTSSARDPAAKRGRPRRSARARPRQERAAYASRPNHCR